MRTRTGLIFGGIALLLVVGGGSFYGGIAFQRAQVASAQARFFASRGGQPGAGGFPGGEPGSGGFPGGGFPFGSAGGGQGGIGRGVFGTVKSIEGDTILVSTAQDVTTVKLTDSTVVEKTVTSDRSVLQPGQQVSVRGDRDSAGIVTAVTLQILGVPPSP